jgi:hypothetical protein
LKIIDVSGFGHSGKTAVSDLLREVKGVEAHDHSLEFGLIRFADGIIDLHSNLTGNWSPLRSDRAIKRFRQLCQKLASGYSNHLNPSFLEISDKYIESLIDGRLFINGWFDPLYDQKKLDINREILKKFGLLEIAKKFAKILRNKKASDPKKTEVFLAIGSDFILKTKKYLEEIFISNNSKKSEFILTNNMFEPFSPTSALDYFEDAYCVIVERDPRDIYASVVNYDLAFIPDFEENNKVFSKNFLKELKEDMLGVMDVQSFITRQKVYYQMANSSMDDDRVVRIKYEDLVLSYESTVEYLFKRLKILPKNHFRKNSCFDPDQSSKNVGLWRKFADTDEMRRIEKELEYLLYCSK